MNTTSHSVLLLTKWPSPRSLFQAASECGGISLVGSSYDGVGVNDSILSARKAVEEVGKPKEEFDW